MQRIKKLLEDPIILLYGILFTANTLLLTIESDIWWILRSGQDIIHGHNTTIDQYSWTNYHRYWPNHQTLWEVLSYALYKIGCNTFTLNIILNSILITTAFILPLYNKGSKKLKNIRVNSQFILVYLMIAIVTISMFSRLRAASITLMLFALFQHLIKKEKYYVIPPLMLLWANMHAGVFIGLLSIYIALISNVISEIYSNGWKMGRVFSKNRKLIICSLISTCCTFFTPMTYHLWVYTLDSSGNKNSLSEWQPLYNFPLMAILIIFTIIIFCINLYKKFSLSQWMDIYNVLLVIVLLVLSIKYVRNSDLLIIACLPSLSNVFISSKVVKGKKNINMYISFLVGLPMIMVGIIITPHIGNAREKETQVSPTMIKLYNTKCAEAETWNSYIDGSYLLWNNPTRRVFYDSRYDYLSKDYAKNITLSASNGSIFLKKHNIKCALVNNNDASFIVFRNNKIWHLMAADNVNSFYMRE